MPSAPTETALAQASRRLKAPREQIGASLEGDLSPAHIFVLEHLIEHVERLEADIAKFDAYLLGELGEPEERLALALMQTVPGIDRIGAALLLVEIGTEMSEFKGPDAIARWSGLCPTNNLSAGKRKKGKKLKGNTWVRRLLCEFALAASKTGSAFQAKYKSLTLRRGHKRAIIACAHKMIRAIYTMLRKREPYRDSTVDLDALMVKRNAPRWIKALAATVFCPPPPPPGDIPEAPCHNRPHTRWRNTAQREPSVTSSALSRQPTSRKDPPSPLALQTLHY